LLASLLLLLFLPLLAFMLLLGVCAVAGNSFGAKVSAAAENSFFC
jgi:hypothetical protein